MKELALVALLSCAPSRAASPIAQPTPVQRDAGVADASAPVDSLASLDDLASRAFDAAPGLHELSRRELPACPVTLDVPVSATADSCVRVLFAASAPVTARLETSKGDKLAAVDGVLGGLLAPRGPVCVRRGDGVRVSFDGAPSTRVRFVAWGSP